MHRFGFKGSVDTIYIDLPDQMECSLNTAAVYLNQSSYNSDNKIVDLSRWSSFVFKKV